MHRDVKRFNQSKDALILSWRRLLQVFVSDRWGPARLRAMNWPLVGCLYGGQLDLHLMSKMVPNSREMT